MPDRGMVDCTLREGDQSPGVAMSRDEKLTIARLLDRAGVALADAGMPELSADERRFLAMASERSEDMVVGASVRCVPSAMDLATGCGVGAVFVICPTSRLHLGTRLGTDLQGLLTRLGRCADRRRDASLEVVCEDATRADPDDLMQVVDHAIALGADRLYLADTVGCRTPRSFADLVARVVAQADGRIGIGVHAHDDLGMATANTVSAVEVGAGWPTACVNGLGERAGNADLAAVSVACSQLVGVDLGVRSEALMALSEAVEAASGHLVAARAPLVGRQVFRHESGIHVDGLLKDPTTYEVIEPATLGRTRELVLGRHSGRAHLRALVRERHPELDAQLSDDHPLWDRLRAAIQEAAGGWDRTDLHALRDRRDALLASQGVPLRRFDHLVRVLTAPEPP